MIARVVPPSCASTYRAELEVASRTTIDTMNCAPAYVGSTLSPSAPRSVDCDASEIMEFDAPLKCATGRPATPPVRSVGPVCVPAPVASA